MAKNRAALTIVLLLLASTLAFPQGYKGKGRFSGTVTDTDGQPLEGVKVKLFCVRGESGFETTTDKQGAWKANYMRGGPWKLEFEKPGYMPKTSAVQINEFDVNPPIETRLERVSGLVVAEGLKAALAQGNALFEQGKYDEAVAAYEKIIAASPDLYVLHKNIGNCYFQMQKYDLAEASYRKVLEKDPQNPEAMLLIGNCYSNRGQDDKAMEWYGQIDFAKITDPMVLFNIGSSFYKQSKLEEALKYYGRAVELKPDFLDALYQLGLVNLAMDKRADAAAAFESYLKYDATSDRAAQVKGFLEFLKKK